MSDGLGGGGWRSGDHPPSQSQGASTHARSKQVRIMHHRDRRGVNQAGHVLSLSSSRALKTTDMYKRCATRTQRSIDVTRVVRKTRPKGRSVRSNLVVGRSGLTLIRRAVIDTSLNQPQTTGLCAHRLAQRVMGRLGWCTHDRGLARRCAILERVPCLYIQSGTCMRTCSIAH